MISRRSLLGIAAVSFAGIDGKWIAAARGQSVSRSGDLIGRLTYIRTGEETILHDVARDHDLGILEISAVNQGIDPWIPGSGRTIMLPTAHVLPMAKRVGLVINKAELRLYHFDGDGAVSTHAIGIGRDGHDTPEGQTTIVRKRRDPTWYPTAATRRDRPELPAQVGPGPDNPLGDRALYFGWPTYLMHGTNKPHGVGRLVSRGCIRLYPEVSRQLFDALAVGTPVNVVEQPIKVGWHEGGLFIEVHADYDQLEDLEGRFAFDPVNPASFDQARQLIEARTTVNDVIDWRTVEAELAARRGIPVQIAGAPVAIGHETGGPVRDWARDG